MSQQRFNSSNFYVKDILKYIPLPLLNQFACFLEPKYVCWASPARPWTANHSKLYNIPGYHVMHWLGTFKTNTIYGQKPLNIGHFATKYAHPKVLSPVLRKEICNIWQFLQQVSFIKFVSLQIHSVNFNGPLAMS